MARRVSSLALTTLMGLEWIIKIKHTNYKHVKDFAAVKLVPKPHEVIQCNLTMMSVFMMEGC